MLRTAIAKRKRCRQRMAAGTSLCLGQRRL